VQWGPASADAFSRSQTWQIPPGGATTPGPSTGARATRATTKRLPWRFRGGGSGKKQHSSPSLQTQQTRAVAHSAKSWLQQWRTTGFTCLADAPGTRLVRPAVTAHLVTQLAGPELPGRGRSAASVRLGRTGRHCGAAGKGVRGGTQAAKPCSARTPESTAARQGLAASIHQDCTHLAPPPAGS